MAGLCDAGIVADILMKIIGKTLGGDLIISVSQAEWDGLQDGIRPKDDRLARLEGWPKTEAGKFLSTVMGDYGQNTIRKAFIHSKIDGSIQSLRDIADGKIQLNYLGQRRRAKLKALLGD